MNRFLTLLSLVCVLSILGCGQSDGPKLGEVDGIVTIDGKPTANLKVLFVPTTGGRTSQGTTNSEGYYQLYYSASKLGAIVGEHEVTISEIADNSDANYQPTVPKKYTDAVKKVTIEGGDNKIDLSYPQ
ncbi:carboxypeptidase regulatory-like domain-containing protein [Calycomorphotria hydatis]|uniref:Carboxypeptidase regulatory-like domain-containing protein n=1 Tax=Calycomorphotria hydatis TaxID=2528027 RepID=A0A517TF71_9PLAN|nr:carboxypeptidase regulatory-like domain-containing protein [Calycomorphotria hydatis]QDT67023.1 hypothetical protein V22_42950 [Calycomorphotria hydatis]